MSEIEKRIKKAEAIRYKARYAAVVMIDAGDPLPDNVGENTVVIIDDIAPREAQKK